MNVSIVGGVFDVVSEIMIAARSAARLFRRQIQGVSVHSQNHLDVFLLEDCC